MSTAVLPRHELEVPAPESFPFALGSFDTIGELSRADFPHRHTFYELVFVTGGTGGHVLDFAERPLHPPEFRVIVPGQVHFWRASGLSGRVVLFTDDFLLAHPDDRVLLRQIAARPGGRLPPATARRAQDVLAGMEHEYRMRETGFASALAAYLHVLVVLAARVPDGDLPTPAEAGRLGDLADRFTAALATPGGVEPSVSAHAARLDVSVSYLTEAVRRATGETPGRLLRRARVLEAKRLLGGTGLSVAQVARQLGFRDPAYFCRFFRREVGATPGGYRRGIHHDSGIESIDRS